MKTYRGSRNAVESNDCRSSVFGVGDCSFEDEGAFEPTSGTGEVSRAMGDIQEFNSCWSVIVGCWAERFSGGMEYYAKSNEEGNRRAVSCDHGGVQ